MKRAFVRFEGFSVESAAGHVAHVLRERTTRVRDPQPPRLVHIPFGVDPGLVHPLLYTWAETPPPRRSGPGRPTKIVLQDLYVSGITDPAVNYAVVRHLQLTAEVMMRKRARVRPARARPFLPVISYFHGDESEPHIHNLFPAILTDGRAFHLSRAELRAFRKKSAEICGHEYVPDGEGRWRVPHGQWVAMEKAGKDPRALVRRLTERKARETIIGRLTTIAAESGVSPRSWGGSFRAFLAFREALEMRGLAIRTEGAGLRSNRVEFSDGRGCWIGVQELNLPDEMAAGILAGAKYQEMLQALPALLHESRNLGQVLAGLKPFGADRIRMSHGRDRADVAFRLEGQWHDIGALGLGHDVEARAEALATDKWRREQMKPDLEHKAATAWTARNLAEIGFQSKRAARDRKTQLVYEDPRLLEAVWIYPPPQVAHLAEELFAMRSGRRISVDQEQIAPLDLDAPELPDLPEAPPLPSILER